MSILHSCVAWKEGATNEREQVVSAWLRMAVYVHLLFSLLTEIRDLSTKNHTYSALVKWWKTTTVTKPFAQDAFNSTGFRALRDYSCSWIVQICHYFNVYNKKPMKITYVSHLSLLLSLPFSAKIVNHLVGLANYMQDSWVKMRYLYSSFLLS